MPMSQIEDRRNPGNERGALQQHLGLSRQYLSLGQACLPGAAGKAPDQYVRKTGPNVVSAYPAAPVEKRLRMSLGGHVSLPR